MKQQTSTNPPHPQESGYRGIVPSPAGIKVTGAAVEDSRGGGGWHAWGGGSGLYLAHPYMSIGLRSTDGENCHVVHWEKQNSHFG